MAAGLVPGAGWGGLPRVGGQGPAAWEDLKENRALPLQGISYEQVNMFNLFHVTNFTHLSILSVSSCSCMKLPWESLLPALSPKVWLSGYYLVVGCC